MQPTLIDLKFDHHIESMGREFIVLLLIAAVVCMGCADSPGLTVTFYEPTNPVTCRHSHLDCKLRVTVNNTASTEKTGTVLCTLTRAGEDFTEEGNITVAPGLTKKIEIELIPSMNDPGQDIGSYRCRIK